MSSEGDKISDLDGIHESYTKEYIEILKSYKNNIKESYNLKRRLKTQFFYIVISILVALILFFIILSALSIHSTIILTLIGKENWQVVASAASGIIMSFSTVIVALNNLPKIIAKYLFDSNEDDSMTHIIKNIQKFEVNMHKKEIIAEKIRLKLMGSGVDIPDKEPKIYGDSVKKPDDKTRTGTNDN